MTMYSIVALSRICSKNYFGSLVFDLLYNIYSFSPINSVDNYHISSASIIYKNKKKILLIVKYAKIIVISLSKTLTCLWLN